MKVNEMMLEHHIFLYDFAKEGSLALTEDAQNARDRFEESKRNLKSTKKLQSMGPSEYVTVNKNVEIVEALVAQRSSPRIWLSKDKDGRPTITHLTVDKINTLTDCASTIPGLLEETGEWSHELCLDITLPLLWNDLVEFVDHYQEVNTEKETRLVSV